MSPTMRRTGEGEGHEEVWIPPVTDCMEHDHLPCPHCTNTVSHARTGRCGTRGRRLHAASLVICRVGVSALLWVFDRITDTLEWVWDRLIGPVRRRTVARRARQYRELEQLAAMAGANPTIVAALRGLTERHEPPSSEGKRP